MNQNIVELKNLSRKFHRQTVLKNVTMSIPRGCVYGLLGTNGAGKSTLLKMLTGLLRPTSGKVIFNGHPWSRKDLTDIGSLIEYPPIYENLTAWENMRVRSLLIGASDERIRKVLRIADISDTGRKKAGAFSLGMKQRLGIALALLGNPKLLVLDEPINGLDPVGIRQLRQLIQSFPEQGITVIISSHILSEIEQTADYIGILANGVLEFEDRADACENLESLFLEITEKGGTDR